MLKRKKEPNWRPIMRALRFCIVHTYSWAWRTWRNRKDSKYIQMTYRSSSCSSHTTADCGANRVQVTLLSCIIQCIHGSLQTFCGVLADLETCSKFFLNHLSKQYLTLQHAAEKIMRQRQSEIFSTWSSKQRNIALTYVANKVACKHRKEPSHKIAPQAKLKVVRSTSSFMLQTKEVSERERETEVERRRWRKRTWGVRRVQRATASSFHWTNSPTTDTEIEVLPDIREFTLGVVASNGCPIPAFNSATYSAQHV